MQMPPIPFQFWSGESETSLIIPASLRPLVDKEIHKLDDFILMFCSSLHKYPCESCRSLSLMRLCTASD